MEKIKIENDIIIEDMWEGLGGNFDNIQQIICEFVDNSISNLIGKNSQDLVTKQVNIAFDVKTSATIENHAIKVTIEDSGTGIIDLNNAFRIGNKSSQESPLNEHGFGLKHALAAADKENKTWKIYTRTQEDLNNNKYKLIEAPYRTNNWSAMVCDGVSWPGTLNTTGTVIQFNIDKNLLSTLTDGIPGANINTSYKRMIEYFIEDIAFIYSTIIDEDLVKINVKLIEDGSLIQDTNVTALKPKWKENKISGTEELDLGQGLVTIDYCFGSIEASENMRYYKRNMASSGAEIRVNGRVLAYNLIQEIWNKQKHNSLNHFLAIINVKSQHKERLPETKTAKNAFKTSDEKYDNLISWIHRKYPTIEEINESNDDFNEVQMFKTLEDNLKRFNQNSIVTTEQFVFEEVEMKLRIDLYQNQSNKVTIFEGKKNKTTPKDVYQLRMYWDGLVLSGIKPNIGIVLGANHPDSVKQMINYINQMKDANGNCYCFECKTWDDYNIEYENS